MVNKQTMLKISGTKISTKRQSPLKILAVVFLSLIATSAFAKSNDALTALQEAAKNEAPIVIYDSTGKIIEMAKGFSQKYGLKAEGRKVKATAQLEMLIREARANNIQGDVSIISDAPAAMAQLIPQKFAMSWFPQDLVNDVPEKYRDPLTIVNSPNVWVYNTTLYDKCPIDNVWQLTESEWRGRVAMQDPLGKSAYVDWFNQLESHGDEAMRKAYEVQFGKKIQTDEKSATAAWIKALAQNGPLLTDSDSAAADAVAASGQKEPFLALISTAKFRDNKEKGMTLGLCTGLKPHMGWLYPSIGLIATGTKSPNSAKLFLHYALTAEGIEPQAVDGKISTNQSVALPKNEPSGIGTYRNQLFDYDMATSLDDWDRREDWQDFWRMNYKR
ncbi:ABC transporter substrate-binding protein [Bartonella sp. HY406]|nr:ABC transporter substrate-binding protein [Bartonella sp. HY406]UXN03515.1 ABC transporter substrate-binding protein [Bartonella sp. HY406]